MTNVASYQDETLVVRDVRVHLLAGGAGEPLLYLHGAGITNVWLPFHARLAAGCHLLAPDLLGFGRTDRPHWLDTVQDFVIHYLDLLDALGLERVHVAGLSLGGWIAAELAVWASHRLKSLTLIDPAGLYLPGCEVPDLFVLDPAQIVRLLVHDPALAERLLAVPETPELAAQRLKGQVTLARVAWNPYLYDPKLSQRLHRVRVPTQLLWGAEDRLFPLAMAAAWRAGLPEARLLVLPDCGHLPPIERPEQCADAISRFVSECAAR
ncbi:MAG TPA: alpha/beta fold hydrolase [Chloroflexota bacterium]|jgi:pimeloyl-ACP methyl ester carboxylesterase|nr:alpha/beta fold hydrolase [Chloroflexota bacterium]